MARASISSCFHELRLLRRLFQQVHSSSRLVLWAAFFSCWFCFAGACWGFFSLPRKDFNANLRRYLTLAVKPERRQGTGSFYCSGAG